MTMPELDGYTYPNPSEVPDGPGAFLNLIQDIIEKDAEVQDDFGTVGAQLATVDTRLVQLEADTGWITPTLGGAWTALPGRAPQYRRKNGIVYIRGRVSGSGTTNIFVLPVGFRMENYAGAVYLLDDIGTPTRIALDGPTGGISPAASGTRGALALDGIPPFPVG